MTGTDRDHRLAAALRANLRRRKTQARGADDAPVDQLRAGAERPADEIDGDEKTTGTP